MECKKKNIYLDVIENKEIYGTLLNFKDVLDTVKILMYLLYTFKVRDLLNTIFEN